MLYVYLKNGSHYIVGFDKRIITQKPLLTVYLSGVVGFFINTCEEVLCFMVDCERCKEFNDNDFKSIKDLLFRLKSISLGFSGRSVALKLLITKEQKVVIVACSVDETDVFNSGEDVEGDDFFLNSGSSGFMGGRIKKHYEDDYLG